MRFLSLKKRRLLISTLYGAVAASAITGMVYASLTGELTGIDLAFVVIGTGAWTISAVQNIYRRAQGVVVHTPDIEEKDAKENPPQKICGLQPSTHMKIGSTLHIIASSCFLAPDIIKLGAPTIPIVTRSAGTFLWFSSAILSYVLANEEEKLEDKKIKNVALCGMDKKYYLLLNELEYFTAAVLFASSIYSQEINIFKATGNTIWFMASIHDTLQATYDAFRNESEEKEKTLPQLNNV